MVRDVGYTMSGLSEPVWFTRPDMAVWPIEAGRRLGGRRWHARRHHRDSAPRDPPGPGLLASADLPRGPDLLSVAQSRNPARNGWIPAAPSRATAYTVDARKI